MKEKTPKADVGVIVGRFQVPELHEAHIELIQSVIEKHPKVIIFLGLSPCKTTYNNPLDFEARKQMILQKFPDVNVLYIKDEASDTVWSRKLDAQIGDIIGANQTALLYGSRDSFIGYYDGKFPTIELESSRIISGTELRKEASNKVKSSPDFRAGVIWAVNNQFPSCFPTVDVAVIHPETKKILLARKPSEKLYRFIGGFASPSSDSYEQDAKREVREETGLEVNNLVYLGSQLIQDWRYNKEIHKIKTIFFAAQYIYGAPVANDDIAEARWFDLNTLNENDLVEEHVPLFFKLEEFVKGDRFYKVPLITPTI